MLMLIYNIAIAIAVVLGIYAHAMHAYGDSTLLDLLDKYGGPLDVAAGIAAGELTVLALHSPAERAVALFAAAVVIAVYVVLQLIEIVVDRNTETGYKDLTAFLIAYVITVSTALGIPLSYAYHVVP